MTDDPDLKLFVAGEWRRADGQPVIDPADESTLGTVPHARRADLGDALAAAEQGFRIWSRTSPARWAEIIFEAVQPMSGLTTLAAHCESHMRSSQAGSRSIRAWASSRPFLWRLQAEQYRA